MCKHQHFVASQEGADVLPAVLDMLTCEGKRHQPACECSNCVMNFLALEVLLNVGYADHSGLNA